MVEENTTALDFLLYQSHPYYIVSEVSIFLDLFGCVLADLGKACRLCHDPLRQQICLYCLDDDFGACWKDGGHAVQPFWCPY